MTKFFCYGDIHLRVDLAQRFLDYEKPSKVIWLGDYLDSHEEKYDSITGTEATAQWLKQTMESRPDDVFLLGNHCLAYCFPMNPAYKICGWTPAKHEAFHRFFPASYWDRFKLFHKEVWNGQTLIFSHAGFHKKLFAPLERLDEAFLTRISALAIENGPKLEYNPLLDDFHDSPMWMRWQRFPLLEGACQIVGHTMFPCPQIRAVRERPEWNLCMDCSHTYYAVFKEKHAYAVNRNTGIEHRLKFSVEN